jgi:hypothetical protein
MSLLTRQKISALVHGKDGASFFRVWALRKLLAHICPQLSIDQPKIYNNGVNSRPHTRQTILRPRKRSARGGYLSNAAGMPVCEDEMLTEGAISLRSAKFSPN